MPLRTSLRQKGLCQAPSIPPASILDAVACGAIALTAGMNAVVIISTAMRRGMTLSIRFVLIGNHLQTEGKNEQTLKLKNANTSAFEL